MPTTKKTTFLQKDCFIVAGNLQENFPVASPSFPTNNLVGTGTALNLPNGYISAVCSSSDSPTRDYYEHLQNGDTYNTVPSIYIVQGTPASADLALAGRFGFGDQPVVKSDSIIGDRIRSVSTTYPNVGSFNAVSVTSVATPTNNTNYAASVVMRGSRQHTYYGQVLDDRQYASFVTPNYTTLGYTANQAKSHMLHNVAGKLAMFSKLWSNVPGRQRGRKNFVVFGINLAGTSTGQALGTITATTTFTWATVNGASLTFNSSLAFVQTISSVIATTALTAASEIVPINMANPIAAANIIDGFMVVALDETLPIAFTDIPTLRERIIFGVEGGFRAALPVIEEGAKSREPYNVGRLLWMRWRANAAIQNSQQNQPHGDFFPIVPLYFTNEYSALYTVTEIKYFDDLEPMNTHQIAEKSVVMLFPAVIDNDTANANTLAGGDYTYLTGNSTLIADTETILGDWLQSCYVYSNFTLHGLCTTSTYFF